MSAWRVKDTGIASSNKEFMLDLLAIINLQIPLKKTKSMLQKYALITKKVNFENTQPIITGCTVKRNYYELYKS